MNFLNLSINQRRDFYKTILLQQYTENKTQQLKQFFSPLFRTKNKQDNEQQLRYEDFRNGNRKQVYNMIHIDAKRCLWSYFEEDNLAEYLSKQITIQNKQGLARFHQRYLELFLIDIMIKLNTKNYFQGMSQIFQCIYFIFLKEEFMSDDNDKVQQYIKNEYEKDPNDFQALNDGIETILYDYDDVVTLSINFFNKTLSVLIKNEISTISHVQMAMEPYLRFFDCQLYQLISNNEQLRALSPNLLMGSVFSCLQYNVQRVKNSVQLMDAVIQGDFYFLTFLACANLSLAFRARNPKYLDSNENINVLFTEGHEKYQITEADDEEVVSRVMTSLDKVEMIIDQYPARVIELAYIGYQIILFSRSQEKEKYIFIANNFDFKKKTFFQQAVIKLQQNNGNKDLFTTVQYSFMTQHKDLFLQMILDSVDYNLTHKITPVPIDTKLQLLGHALEKSNKNIRNKLQIFAQNIASKLDKALSNGQENVEREVLESQSHEKTELYDGKTDE